MKDIFERIKELDEDMQFNIRQLIVSDGLTDRTLQIIEKLIETSKKETAI